MKKDRFDYTSTSKGLIEDTVCLQLSFRKPGDKIKADKNAIEVNSDKDMLHLSKTILESKELNKIRGHRIAARTHVRSLAIPSPMFKSGVHCIPVALIEDVNTKLEEAKKKDNELIEKFMDAYDWNQTRPDGLISQAKKKLKALFDEADYPSPGRMKRAFNFEWNFFSFQTPENLSAVSSSLFKKEKEKMRLKWQEAQEEVVVLLRAEFKSLVDHITERLTPEDRTNGKKKFFKGATVTSVSDFLGTFPFRNVCDDKELDTLIQRTRKLLDGVDIKELQKSEALKANMNAGFAVVKKRLDVLVKDKPARLISLEGEE